MTENDAAHPVAVKVVEAAPVKPSLTTASWKDLALQWLFDQSVSTILLVIIICGAPIYVLPQIQEGYRQNAALLQATVKLRIEAEQRDREAYAKYLELILITHDRDRESFERAMRAISGRMP